ncbi:hypothetical protein D9758_009519 [Tetrapyrgos nigripes]|uniref:Uncharacterized protein n=1 Tax=Tetrapyrgos nigripes TaxID=182062 RepID=A0A8H5G193_9AGAR|nr:hypothetical protein D9758_009519 [Tetrapyrgos nigripes]
MYQSSAMKLLGFATLLAFSVPVHSANDWSVPCLNGTCEYDLPSTSGASGSLQVWGAISDITTAAGWEILGCSSDDLSQDIRLVCMNNSTSCDHLYENGGAEGKLVRLPENCGKSAFARVARAWVPDDQSIPSNIAARIVRRDGSSPQVKALALDTDFSGASAGPVGFRVAGVNVPGVDVSAANAATPHLRRRGLFDIVSDALSSASDATDFDINNSTQLEPFDIDKSFNLLNKSLSCGGVDATLSVDVDAKAHVTAAVGLVASGSIFPPDVKEFALTTDFSAKLNGTLNLQGGLATSFDSPTLTLFEIGIPGLDFPGLFSIGPNFQINAQATADLSIGADLTVGLNYEIKNGHLVFPPSGSDNSSDDSGAKGDQKPSNKTEMGMQQGMGKGAMDDNSTSSNSSGDFEIQDTPLQLSLSPSVEANGSVSAHLIPTLNLGVNALDGLVKANVFLNLDTSATLALSLEGSAGDIQVGKRTPTPPVARAPIVKSTSIPRAVAAAKAAREAEEFYRRTANNNSTESGNSTESSSKSNSNSTDVSDSSSNSNSTQSSSDDSSAGFGGCLQVLAGLDVNAGAEGNLFDLFDDSTQVSLFSKEFQLFQKCFGNQADNKQRRSILSRRYLPESGFARRANETDDGSGNVALAAECLASAVGAPASVVDTAVKALDILSNTKSKPSTKA